MHRHGAGIAAVCLVLFPTIAVAADLKPAAVDAKPAAVDAKPAAADTKPAAADTKPAATDRFAFNGNCSADDQCIDGVCRYLTQTARVCTRFCTLSSSCPDGARCRNGLCVPASYILPDSCSGASCSGQSPTVGGGCSFAARDGESKRRGSFLPLLLLVLGWFLRPPGMTRRRNAARSERDPRSEIDTGELWG